MRGALFLGSGEFGKHGSTTFDVYIFLFSAILCVACIFIYITRRQWLFSIKFQVKFTNKSYFSTNNWNKMQRSEEDNLFEVKTYFYIGAYQQVLNETVNSKSGKVRNGFESLRS